MTTWPKRMNSPASERPQPRETPVIRMILDVADIQLQMTNDEWTCDIA
jgi:hypothetical protein